MPNFQKKIVAAVAVAVAFAALLVTVALSLTSGSVPGDAAAILRSSHYSVIYEADGSSQPANVQQYTSSIAFGNNTNGQSEIVLVFKSNINGLEPELKSEILQQDPGFTVTYDGNVFEVSGPTSEFGSLTSNL